MFNDDHNSHYEDEGFDDGYRHYPPPRKGLGRAFTFIWRVRPLRYLLLAIVLALVVTLGVAINKGSQGGNYRPIYPATAPVPTWQLDRELSGALASARSAADDRAKVLVGRLVDGMHKRVGPFLDRHCSYARQQELGLRGLWYTCRHAVDATAPKADNALRDVIMRDFMATVVRPGILNHELGAAASEVVACYLTAASSEIEKIPSRMPLPQAAWESFASDLAQLTADVNSNRRYPIAIKVIGTGGALATARLMLPRIAAGRVGAAIAAKITGRMCIPLIGVLSVLLDVYDHQVTSAQARRVLEKNTGDYIETLKTVLTAEIMGVVGDVESQIIAAAPKSEATTKKEEK